jgi:hypothetical protein
MLLLGDVKRNYAEKDILSLITRLLEVQRRGRSRNPPTLQDKTLQLNYLRPHAG